MNPKRGDVWLVDLGMPTGYEQAGERPAIVIQSDDLGQISTTIVIPLTTSDRDQGQKGTVTISPIKGVLDRKSFALCYQVRVLDKIRLKKRFGQLPPANLSDIDITLAYILDLAI